MCYNIDSKEKEVKKMKQYIAVFHDTEHGYFMMVCEGYYMADKNPVQTFPTVEEVVVAYADNAEFVKLI